MYFSLALYVTKTLSREGRVRGRAFTSTLTVGVRQRSSLLVGVLRPSALWESVFLLQWPGKDSEGQHKTNPYSARENVSPKTTYWLLLNDDWVQIHTSDICNANYGTFIQV